MIINQNFIYGLFNDQISGALKNDFLHNFANGFQNANNFIVDSNGIIREKNQVITQNTISSIDRTR